MKENDIPTPTSSSPSTPDNEHEARRLYHAQMVESLQNLLTPPRVYFTDPHPVPPGLAPIAAELDAMTARTEAALKDGARTPLDDNLIPQARLLDALFHSLIRRHSHGGISETALRSALNAQRQYRYTVETLRKAQKNTPNELNKP